MECRWNTIAAVFYMLPVYSLYTSTYRGKKEAFCDRGVDAWEDRGSILFLPTIVFSALEGRLLN